MVLPLSCASDGYATQQQVTDSEARNQAFPKYKRSDQKDGSLITLLSLWRNLGLLVMSEKTLLFFKATSSRKFFYFTHKQADIKAKPVFWFFWLVYTYILYIFWEFGPLWPEQEIPLKPIPLMVFLPPDLSWKAILLNWPRAPVWNLSYIWSDVKKPRNFLMLLDANL